YLLFVITKWRMQVSGENVKGYIAELSRIKMELKIERVHICNFSVLCVWTVNGVMWVNIANYI
ncbi:MAG: hypothetical protein ACT6FD_02455, partial [Methanosarcinaceae archaeon]